MKNKHPTLDGGQKKVVFGGPKEVEARRAHRKGRKRVSEGEFSHLPIRKECRL